jgi:hypothetical protein
MEVNKYNLLNIIDVNQDVDEFKQHIINTKKIIIKEINNLNKFEHIEIFKILKSHNVSYTENINGIFINLSPININVLNNIITFINYVKNKNIELLEKENNQQKTKEKIFGDSDKNIENLESKIQMLKDNLKNNLEILSQ